MWSIWPSIKKKLFYYLEFLETKSQRRKDVPLDGSWIVHIFIAWGKKLSYFCIYRKTLGRYSHKLSIISKQSRLMHKELKYQVKTHAISNMPRERECNMELTSYARQDQTWWCQYRKTVARPAFSVFPNKYLQRSLKRHRGQKHNWFLDCI